MPFFVADPDWQGRARDGIPGQSLTHRPVMEDSDCSSSDDDEDIEVDVNPDRMSRPSHRDPHTAAKEYHQSQLEEIIVAIKDFDTYAARYPPEAMPKPRHVLPSRLVALLAFICALSYYGEPMASNANCSE